MNKRAFTLVEILIVMGLISILAAPISEYILQFYREYDHYSRLSQLKSDTSGAAHRIMSEMARVSTFQIDGDNRGLTLAGGNTVRWRDDQLVLSTSAGAQVLAQGVQHFSVVRRGSWTTLTFELDSPRKRYGARPYRITYDYPPRSN